MIPSILGIGGAPTRATTLPIDAKERKAYPVASGCLDYFPDALAAIAHLSYIGNEQHNKGKPLHWDRSKSGDEADTMLRHFLQRGTIDKDGVPHSVKMAWRALALLQKELEENPGSIESKPESISEYDYCFLATSIYRYRKGSSDLGERNVKGMWMPEVFYPRAKDCSHKIELSETEVLRICKLF